MYIEATKLDQYLAIAYFQEGVSNFLLGDFEEALGNFNDALLVICPVFWMLTDSTFAAISASITNNLVLSSNYTLVKFCLIGD